MTKKLPLILTASAVVALALISVVFYQGDYISELKQTILNNDKQLVLVSQKLDEQTLLNDELRNELQVYKDSVSFLQLENQQLHAKIDELKGTISKLNKLVQKHDDKVRNLTSEITRLKEGGKKNADKVAKLEQERDDLLVKMEELDKERSELQEAQRQKVSVQKQNEVKIETMTEAVQKTEEQIDQTPMLAPAPIINQSPSEHVKPEKTNVPEELQTQIVARQQERIKNIVSKTAVKFSSISLRQREGGNELRSLKKEDGWRYTFVDFDLDNMDKEAIMDETFIIQVYDLDNDVVVPFNERNNAFPNSDMGAIGYKFKYDGKPVTVRYINTQPKEGRNYELRLIYCKKDLIFPLVNGTKKIVEDGKVTVN